MPKEVNSLPAGSPARPSHTQWQYLHVTIISEAANVALNQRGDEGWELVLAVPHYLPSRIECIFKRPVEQVPDETVEAPA